MPYEESFDAISRAASGALATTRVGVVINSSDALAAATAGAAIDGILLTTCTATTDEPSFVPLNNCLGGILVRAGGTCTAGADAMVTTDGKFIDATAGNITVGRFETGTTTSGDLVRMLPYARPQVAKGSTKTAVLALAGGAASSGVFASWTNPEAGTIVVTRVSLYISTQSTGASTLDIGTTATSATTTSDNLIDGVSGATAGAFNNITDIGTNGKSRQTLATGKFLNVAEASGDVDGLVGKLFIEYLVP